MNEITTTQHQFPIFIGNSFENKFSLFSKYIDDILQLIQTGGDYINLYNQARDKNITTIDYDAIKGSLPVWMPNSILKGNSKRIDDFLSSTGYLYIDIDDLTNEESISLKLELSKNKYVYACWLSLSGKGVGVLLRVSDKLKLKYNKNTCQAIYYYGADLLGVTPCENSYTVNRLNVISYDPNIYININSIPVQDSEHIIEDKIIINKGVKKQGATCCYIPQEKKNTYNTKLHPVNNRNGLALHTVFPAANFKNDEIYQYFEEGYDSPIYFQGKKKVKEGKRHHAMFAFACGIIKDASTKYYSKPFAKDIKRIIYHFCNRFNITGMVVPLSEKEFKQIMKNAFAKLNSGNIKCQNKRKKIKFNINAGLTSKDKQIIARKVIGYERSKKTFNNIYNKYISLPQPTQKIISQELNISLRTVKNYWKKVIEKYRESEIITIFAESNLKEKENEITQTNNTNSDNGTNQTSKFTQRVE